MEVCHGATWCTLMAMTFTCRTVPNVALQQVGGFSCVVPLLSLEVAQPD